MNFPQSLGARASRPHLLFFLLASFRLGERASCPHLLFAFLVAFSLSACSGAPSKPPADSRGAASSSPAASKSVPKIVAFGDSLTAGLGLPQSASYPSLLQKKLAADGLEYEVVNAGVSGDTTAGGLRRIDWALEGGDVRIVILELGANDILRGQPIDQMKKNLAATIERAQARGARVLLAGMEAPTSTGSDYRREIHEAFVELAREHQLAMIPFFLEGVAGIDSLNQADGIHPNADGTKIVAETVYRSLRPLLD
ncbi:MAG: arylesterase [Acidobacteriota bacterium]